MRGALRSLKRLTRLLLREVFQRGMRPDCIVIVTLECQLSSCFLYTVEDFLIEQLVPKAAVEAFDERVLLRLVGIDVVPMHGSLVSPLQDCPAGEPRAVVADNAAWLAIEPDQGTKLPDNPCSRQASVCDKAQAFPRAIVYDRQHSKLPRSAEAVGHEVQ